MLWSRRLFPRFSSLYGYFIRCVGLEIPGRAFDSQPEALELHFSQPAWLGLKMYIFLTLEFR